MICHQLPPGSFPVISILVFAGIIPSTGLAVDGSRRTLIWVEVIPSTGGTVGWGEAGSEVCNGAGIIVPGSVEVMTGGVWVGIISPGMREVQLVLRIRITMAMLEKRMDTAGFYRLSHACGTCVSNLFEWNCPLRSTWGLPLCGVRNRLNFKF